MSKWPAKFSFIQQTSNEIGEQVQAALVIRGLGIRGFDYSRVRKQGKTANSEGNLYPFLFSYVWKLTPSYIEGDL